jgi:hypothetical protein
MTLFFMRNIKNGGLLKTLGLAGAIAFANGCNTMNPSQVRRTEERVLGILLGVGGITHDEPAAVWTGQGLVDGYNAGESGSTVIINHYPYSGRSLSQAEKAAIGLGLRDGRTGEDYFPDSNLSQAEKAARALRNMGKND